MLRSRIIPCLLIHKNGLVKTINFKDPKYVGDPINAVKIFNEKKVDEIMVLDIDASVHGNEPNYELISKLANECRMPLCYGGGVKNTEQIKRIVELGSGMEKMMASLAIRVALINVSSLPKTSMLMIDEGFGALDETNLEACGKLLQSLKKWFKNILVISHIDAIKDIVDNNIDIIKKGVDSYVYQP